MKIFGRILLFCLLNSVAWGYTLVKAESSPGYVMNPMGRTFVLDSSGRMTLTIEDFRGGFSRVERIGVLSLVEILKIKSDIASSSKAVLIDKRPEDPICADAPGYKVSFFINGVSKPVYSSAQCHEFVLQGDEGNRTIDLALAFLKM